MRYKIPKLIAVIVILILLILGWCKKPREVIVVQHDTITKIEQVTIRDTITVIQIEPKEVIKIVTKKVELTRADSAEIVGKWYDKKMYSDTLLNDYRGTIRIDEQVSQNSIVWRKLYYTHINTKEIKTVTTTKTIKEGPTWNLYGNFIIMPSIDNIQCIPGLVLTSPKGIGGGFHYDVVSHNIGVSFVYKIF